MKKLFCLLMVLLMMLLIGCSSVTGDPPTDAPGADEATEGSAEPTNETDSASTPPEPEPTELEPTEPEPTEPEPTEPEPTEPEPTEPEPTEPEPTEPEPVPEPAPGDATVTYTPNMPIGAQTYTGAPALPAISYIVSDPMNARGLSTERLSHSFGVASGGAPHHISVNNQARFDELDLGALTWDNQTAEKVLYLTFDCGYEYENLTSLMLDTLAEKQVPGAFFCTMDYLRTAPSVVARMIEEGHIVGNHSTTHPSDCSVLSREEMAWEILGVHNYLRVNFGYDCHYFRFPAGVYSNSALELAHSVGYRSAFWSIAYVDWDPEDQMGADPALQTVTSRLHPGAVILLHTTSPDNAQILGDFIDYARAEGYEFRSLDEWPGWD